MSERGRDGQLSQRLMAMNRRVEIHLVADVIPASPVRSEKISEESLQWTREGGQILGREGRREQEEESEALSAGLTAAGITADIQRFRFECSEVELPLA